MGVFKQDGDPRLNGQATSQKEWLASRVANGSPLVFGVTAYAIDLCRPQRTHEHFFRDYI